MAPGLILTAFFKALAQLGDRRFRSVLWRGIGLTLGLFVAAFLGLRWLLGLLTSPDSWLGFLSGWDWLQTALSASSLLVTAALSVFLMVPVASAFTSLFLDDVADAVEERHYPTLPPVPKARLSEVVTDSLAFLGVIVAANIAAFAAYIAFPPAAPFIFFGLNGFLLGREYFQLAAMRRLGRAGARDLRRGNAGTIFVAGLLMAVPLVVPFLGLIVPILGAATFTHIYHGLAARR
ncbi:EI24 domain-containing protein [Rhodalgimonas zhirmunskyi]|uniref:EI24 domain-containing protein n=1 Tax=Rhodalgimonas zhirmunskyi TaxID=2964767 RepID=A0AAJ1X7G1_9RHOB|nr:EI24 domain-containing protein [Rhodoalgimonas zhirmunskyi]MDQ2095664.1 EI24 domain-containing protein [Rhodoalgimonas zhirmunskyi]